MDAKELAVVAFWDLDPEDDKFKCTRFFIVPSPMKRTIKEVGTATLSQILYTSQHNKEVFFFFMGYKNKTIEDLVDHKNDHKLQIAFLKLDINEEERLTIGEARHFMYHCKNIVTIPKENVLHTFVRYFDRTNYTSQK